MISYLEGTVQHAGETFAIINAGGVGYTVTMVPKLVSSLSKSQDKVNPSTGSGRASFGVDGEGNRTIKLFIHSRMNVREGTFDLYGFDSKQDLDLFNLLISVSGIGPKNAIHILSTIEPKHLKAAIANEDADYLKKVSGLGPKTAQRLILELHNKVDYLKYGDERDLDLGQESQAMEALLALGYNMSQAKDSLQLVSKKATNLQDRVREALKILGKK